MDGYIRAIDEDKLNHAISYGMDELTKPYDNFEIVRIGFRILFKVSRHTRDRKYICSELVYDCFDRIDVPFRLRDEYVSPDDIWLDEQVQLSIGSCDQQIISPCSIPQNSRYSFPRAGGICSCADLLR